MLTLEKRNVIIKTVKGNKSIKQTEVRTIAKYIVTREATIYIVVNAENETDAIEKTFEEHDLDEYRIDGADDDAKVEEYMY